MKKIEILLTLVTLFAISASIFTISKSVTNYNTPLPYITEFTATPSELKGESFIFTYDPVNNTFTAIDVDVKNYGSTSNSGTVYIYLFNATGFQIAYGVTNTGSISAGVTVGFTIPLTWSSGKTVLDYASGRCAIV